ncbi:hypothetical protein K469DRAFT_701584 [Zopfia rhizophila CBS 207.26]|uniref:Uncharacterized protein n=1 Tax=Zopfia rhizophila CBS 207.26 TaxID=1314779 RepID=A0A6A6DBT5_9PEZI|nr:hypothetical protein K469DRAFT_701584 [Zopfia rhizophila CBS 207.26]
MMHNSTQSSCRLGGSFTLYFSHVVTASVPVRFQPNHSSNYLELSIHHLDPHVTEKTRRDDWGRRNT